MVRDMKRKQIRIEKYFKEHPEVLDELKSQLLQYSDTIDQLDDADIPDFQEFLARNKIVAEHYNKADRRSINISCHFSKPWYRKIGFVLPVTLALLICCFLAFTTTGKALAESIYQTVIRWFDHSVSIQHGSEIASEEPSNIATHYYDSLSDVQSLLNVSIAQNHQAVLCEQILVTQIEGVSSVIKSTYLSDSHQIVITQTNFMGDTRWSSNLQYDDGTAVNETADGVQFVGYVLDNHGFVIAYTEKTSIQIDSEDIDYDRFVSFIKGMVIE